NTGTNNSPASTTTSSIVSSSSSSLSNGGSTGGLFSSPPRLRTSCSTTDLGSKSLFSTNTSTDWPFPISKKSNEIDSWSFGSLNKKKLVHTTSAPGSTASSIIGSKKKDDHLPWAIQEEQEDYCKLSATITSSLSALEQAQARLRQDLPKSTTPWSPSQKTVQTPKTETLPNSVTQPNTRQVLFTPETISNDEKNEEKPLTGLARRRKRSSAARALKDKIAAETVDFELMKDVQNWLRSLRLHKYGHAFIGLDWKQVIRMTDQDMIDAGVNTIGARRKLLKVFENVARHCDENDIEY
ncbi:Flap-structured DNA-binding and RNA-binding protein, partial [Rhizopus stolonifer]